MAADMVPATRKDKLSVSDKNKNGMYQRLDTSRFHYMFTA